YPEMASPLSLLLLVFSRLSGAYRASVKTGGSTTITCQYIQEYKTHVKYLCKRGSFKSCSSVERTDPPKSTGKISISDDINQRTFTVTMTDLEPEDSGYYWCAVEINGANDWTGWFYLSVTPGTPELYVDQQEVTGVEGGSVIVNCYYRNTGNRKWWCRIGGSVYCVEGNAGTIDGTSVTLQQTTDATKGNVLTVTLNGLKMENTDWYRCEVGDLMMPVHIAVRQQTTTQTSTMTTTQAPTTEQSSFSPAAEPVQTDNTVQGPEGGVEDPHCSPLYLKVLLIPLGMLVVVIAGVLVTWKIRPFSIVHQRHGIVFKVYFTPQ
uniref:Ig-like domain-containing protein n=1 Tax=Hucho hucho TaxID=62062 RepID=A0A4W5LKX8_9TELE